MSIININKFDYDSNTYILDPACKFGICSTPANTAAKAVNSLSGGTFGTFVLEDRMKIAVKFSNKNTEASPTLNVCSTGAKPIYINNAALTAANAGLLYGVIEFMYDATSGNQKWEIIGNYIDTDTKNTAGATDTSNKIFLVGATAQNTNPQTYSQDTAYVGADGHLYSNSQKVLNVDMMDTAIETTATDNNVPTSKAVKDAIDTIQVGGRNYLRNSRFFDGWEEIITEDEGDTTGDSPIVIDEEDGIGVAYFPEYSRDYWAQLRPNNNLSYSYVRGKTITLSTEIKGTNGQTLCVMMMPYITDGIRADRTKWREICLLPQGTTTIQGNATFVADGTWQKVSATFTLEDSVFTSGDAYTVTEETYFGARIARLNTNHNAFAIRLPKIEIGNKATDWIPAIEDSGMDVKDNTEKDNLLSSQMFKLSVSGTVGTIASSNGGYYTGMYCEIQGNKTYVVSRKADNGRGVAIYWTAEKPEIGVEATLLNALKSPKNSQGQYTHNGILSTSVKPPAQARYLFLRVNNTVPACRYDYNLKVEEGSIATGWKHSQSDLIATPQMYGAVADGITDDTDAIQLALDSGANIFFPNGVYLISYPLIVRGNCHVYGNGPMSILRACNGFNRSNIPHGSSTSIMQQATYQFMTSANHQVGTVSYILNYIDCPQTQAMKITNSPSSALILENLQLDCNYTSSTSNSTVGGIRIMRSYNAGNIRNIVVTNCAVRGIYVGDQKTLADLKGLYSSTSSVSYEQDFYNWFHNTDNVADEDDWMKLTRTQSLQISNCLFQTGSIPTSATISNSLGYFYNALELNLVDTKFLFQSRSNTWHNVACLYLNYSTDAYIRGCSFTNGKIGVHLDNACRYFRLIGNTYERIPTTAQGTAAGLSGCYCIRVSGTSARHTIRGIIMEMPYSDINDIVRLEYCDKILVTGGFSSVSKASCTGIVENLTG